jgi:2-polyprenyl-6-hydroxyphenyl methylase/3-demethylubiquinone-9 3-methyltransferase
LVALSQGVTNPDRAVAKRVFEVLMTMTKIDVAAIEAARR